MIAGKAIRIKVVLLPMGVIRSFSLWPSEVIRPARHHSQVVFLFETA